MNLLREFFSYILLLQFSGIYPYVFEARSYTSTNTKGDEQKVVVYYDAHAQMEYPNPTQEKKNELRKQRDAFVKKIQETEGVSVLVEDVAIPSEYPVGDGGSISFKDNSDVCYDLKSPLSYEFLYGLTKQLSTKGIGVEKRHYILRSAPNFSKLGSSVTNVDIKYIIAHTVCEAYDRCQADKDSVVWKMLNFFGREVKESALFKAIDAAPANDPAVITFKKLGQEACIGLAPIEDMHLISHMYDLLYNQNKKLIVVCAGSYHANAVSQALEYFGFKLQQGLGGPKKIKNILNSSCFDLIK